MDLIKFSSAERALAEIKSGMRVFVHGGACTPVFLLKNLIALKDSFENVEVTGMSLHGDINFDDPSLRDHLYINSLFVSGATRKAVNSSWGDYLPVFLSEIPKLFRENYLPLDIAILQLSLPDEHGYCSFGPSVDIAKAASETAKIIIAQINPNVPRVYGDGVIHISKIHHAVYCDDPLAEVVMNDESPVCAEIGKKVASLIEDGATLQIGIGNIPNMVLKSLRGHKHLGVHTEMFSDGLIELIENGNIDNSKKKVNKGKTVSGFILGTSRLYKYIDRHPLIRNLEIDYVNNPSIIAKNPKVTAVNCAIEIDLTGQVCSDSIGSYQYSGIGGQLDFIRGASLSEGGKPIIALTSVAKNGQSKIVPVLKQGAGVVTTRGHVHWVVTEYGVVNLFGMNMERRAKALISIAHPMHRENLERAFRERFL
ncbi:MAG: 4-hydroxybutyrate CoA-transferase [Cytophagaceae bacterium]|nr:4-hydroxybutyrate CoA-transferase [Cytophagaceae bacterium]